MKKILSILVCVCVLLSAMVFTASAADTTVKITFDDLAKRTSISTSQQIWEESGITLTNNKGDSTTDINEKYYNPIRCYKDSIVTIEYPGMKTIVIDSFYDSTYSKDYATPWADSFDPSLGTAVVNDDYDVTITLNSAVDSLTFAKMSGQGRAYSITVYTGGAAPTPPATDEDDKDDTTTSAVTLVETPVAGTAYKFGMVQGNLNDALYYITGVKGGYNNLYMATTTDYSAAADVYLEEVEGGYNLYTMVEGTKKYINMVVSGKYVNGEFQDIASTVYTYDTTSKTVLAEDITTTEGTETYWFGTRNDKTYDTVGPCAIKYEGFYCQFYTVGTGEDVTPPAGDGDEGGEDITPPAGDEDDKPVELPAPDETNTITIAEAIELGKAQEDTVYTDKYYVTGVITAIASTTWGNVYITDEDGNSLYVYGMYSADGETRYDELESKPDEGDTVTLYGGIGQYGGAPQMKNAWLIEFTAGELEVEDTDPEADSVLSIKDAIALGESKLHNTYTEGKYYITGTILEVYNEDYGNLYLVDAEGNQITVYGSWNEDGTIGYAEMENKPVAGDTVTLYGIIGQYNGTAQMKNGWFKSAPVVDDDTTNDDNATGGTTGDSNANTDNSTTSPSTGDNVGAIVAMAVAAAAVLVASKKR